MQASFATETWEGTAAPLTATGLAGIDVRAKIAVSLLASAVTVALSNPVALLGLFGASLLYALGMRRPVAQTVAYAVVAFMFLMALGWVALLHWLFPPLPAAEFDSLGTPFLRALTMVNVLLPMAFTCRVQALLTSLKSLHLPFCLYIPAAVMIRFIPAFLFDIRQVLENLRIRGFRMTPGACLCHPVLMGRLLFTPMLFRALKTSEELGIAAEFKGLGYGGGLCPYRRLKWKRADTLLLAAALLAAGLAVACALWLGNAPAPGGMH